MRTRGSLVLCCWWTLLHILFSTYVPLVTSVYAAHSAGSHPNSCHNSRRNSFLALLPDLSKCATTSSEVVFKPSPARKPPPLCESVWYRDFLLGVCRREGPHPPPDPSVVIPTEPVKLPLEGDLAAAAALESATAVVEKEWTKNFASPECGAKLGMLQLLPGLDVQYLQYVG